MKILVKTMQISNFNDNNFNQSDSNISLWIIRCEAVVYWLKALIGSLQEIALITSLIGSF